MRGKGKGEGDLATRVGMSLAWRSLHQDRESTAATSLHLGSLHTWLKRLQHAVLAAAARRTAVNTCLSKPLGQAARQTLQ